MKVTYDEKLNCPTYVLTKEETDKLETVGFIQDDENGIVITAIDKKYSVAKITKERESILLNY
jgi:hypothetical protein